MIVSHFSLALQRMNISARKSNQIKSIFDLPNKAPEISIYKSLVLIIINKYKLKIVNYYTFFIILLISSPKNIVTFSVKTYSLSSDT